ncbi:hypothetical protein Tsubulata_003768 [Turnera subulata]|uniref:Uncharacterized protein n=2 Tax=Malpighiales TaxID=3646 RepID=A0A9Q0JGS0_9ROSI|nr:hypothetical protein Tsubulata_003768 [Turnera subulata]
MGGSFHNFLFTVLRSQFENATTVANYSIKLMAANVPPGAPRQQPPPNYVPNYQQNPNMLADNMQNLNLNRPPTSMPQSSAPRPSPFGQPPPPFPSSGPSQPLSRPGPPPPASVSRPNMGFQPPTLPSGRPAGPPFSQPSPFGSRAPPPGSLPSSIGSGPVAGSAPGAPPQGTLAPPQGARPGGPAPFASAPGISQSLGAPGGLVSNGPPAPGFQGGPRFPSTVGAPQQPPMGPPGVARGPPQMPGMRPTMGSPGMGAPPGPPFGASPQATPTFSAPPPGMPPQMGSPFAQHMQSQSVPPPGSIPGSAQPPRMYGMSPPMPNQMTAISPVIGQTGSPLAGTSKIDPNQIPRPIPTSSVTLHDTRQGNQANPPPPATSDFIVKDTGNCSPRYMRCTISQIPCTADLLNTSGMQLALLVQPLALPHPSEEPIQVVDFGEGGPVRCSRCKGYINPFMKFIDQGRRFICNFCGFTDETPREYHCNLGPDGRRRDADERPELCRGTVEFVATREYMVRDPMPAVYFFLIDVSMNSIQTGATAAACSSVSQVIADLPEGPRTMVGVATFDSTIHFYNLKRTQQPLMLIVPDVLDVYTPLQSDVIVPLSECRQHLEQLLESIPTMFQDSRTAESAFCAAMKAAFLAMKSTGGKLLLIDLSKAYYDFAMFSVLPSIGIGALSAREAEGRSNISAGEKEAHKLLQPADKTLKEMAIEFAEYQVCVDVFITTQSYVDIASISVIPKTTGGQVYYYYPFSAVSDTAKLYNDLRWNVTRPQGFEAVMRVRCSQGIQVQEYQGNFCKRIPTDVDLPGIDCDKTIMVTLKHDDKLQDGSECAFQCALLYTTVYGQRRIRVATLSLPCTNNLSNLFRVADLDTQFVCFLKQAASEIPTTPPLTIREREGDASIIPPALPLSSEHVSENGIYLLEDGQDGLVYIGSSVDSDILVKLFGISSAAELPNQFVLKQFDNPLSKRLNDVVNEIRRQRCSYLRLSLCKKGDPSGLLFFSHLVEDKVPTGGLSYVEFLVHVHRQIQNKMSS